MKKLFFSFILVFLSILQVYADSPLTSTDFYRAYLDIPVVKKAADNPGKLTKDMMEYLYDDKNPLDIRIALINALGWSIDGLSTMKDYIEYCFDLNIDKVDFGYLEDEEAQVKSNFVIEHATCEQLAILVYLQAMSNYFDTQNNYAFWEYAMQTPLINKQSFMLPMGLVLAQTALDMGDWGNIYPAMNFYLFSPEIQDVRPEAIKIIMDYINGYKEYADRP